MINITGKSSSLRKAIAIATVNVSLPATMEALQQGTVPKGNVLESARVAALFAAKKTSEVIPDCHPLPVEFTEIRFNIQDMSVIIEAEIHTIYKTGVEVEAMYAASVAALTMYDMLKPIDKGIEISNIKLIQKTGGKSDLQFYKNQTYTSAVIVCSDSVSAGQKKDSAGLEVIEKLKKFNITNQAYQIIPDQTDAIQQLVTHGVASGVQLIMLIGGTGLSLQDITPEAVRPLLETEIPGLMETARQYGQQRMPFAMLSRGIAGFIQNTLVLTLPGSTKGATETIDALFPSVLHVFDVRNRSSGWENH